jgi:pyruvate dehydrogenase E2 component (dihydrolipoamide acetyltransferase)
MTEGKIVRWIVAEGARVRRGDPIVEIETDKANLEVEAAADGILRKVLRAEGEVVPVLTPVAVIGAPDEPLDLAALSLPGAPGAQAEPSAAPADVPAAAAAPAEAGQADGAARASGRRAGRVAASPLARGLARRHDIDLHRLRGSGPGGRIIRRDVEAAAGKGREEAARGTDGGAGDALLRPAGKYPPPSPRPPARVAIAGMRKAIASALQRSKAVAPHFYATAEIDLTAALAARQAPGAPEVSVNDVLIRAVAIALADEPRVSCRVHDDAIEYPPDVNIGIAVGLEDGLVVPVITRAQTRSLVEIAAESRRIIELARGGKLVGSGQGTFTVSNLGMFGVKCFTAVINPPEGAILAVGAAVDRVVPAGGGFIPRKILEVTLSADHRAIDGLLAARFLQRLRRLLEDPARIF